MKKLISLAGALMIGYVMLSAAAGVADDGARTVDQSETEAQSAVYTVASQMDRVVVYRGKELYLRTDTQASALPKSDRERLARGIDVYSDRELKALLEDLCS